MLQGQSACVITGQHGQYHSHRRIAPRGSQQRNQRLGGDESGRGTLEFNWNINETVGALTLSANSVIDMGGGNVALEFSNLVTQLTSTTRLNIYNYTLYSDHLYFTSNANVSDSLQYISFYSGFGTGFISNSFISSFSSPWQVQPVPEPETWATAVVLLIGGGVWMCRRKRQNSARA